MTRDPARAVLDDAIFVSAEETWRARDRLLRELDARERAALEHLSFEPRQKDRLAGRLAARRAVQRLTGLRLARITVHRSEDPAVRGRPEVWVDGCVARDLCVSIAHSEGLAVARADHSPIGVDLELVEVREPGFEALVFSVGERRALDGLTGLARAREVTRRFALKEATGKMLGVGLARAFEALEPPAGARVRAALATFAGRELVYVEVIGAP